jgi:NodT family efflux transporter outer membrane factor (OMF) lipoprotein
MHDGRAEVCRAGGGDCRVLDRLVDEALQQNLSLRAAGLRVLQAQQNLAITTGKRYPQQQALTGSAEIIGLSENSMDHLELNHSSFGTYGLGFQVAWEVDFWGKFRRMVQQAGAQLDARVAQYDDAMLSLIAEVAQGYLLLRTVQERMEIAAQNISLQQSSVVITQAKVDVGQVTELDLDQAQTLLHNTRASLAGFEIVEEQVLNSLSILLGRQPGELDDLLATASSIPEVPPEIAVGMPQNLIRRRPDIRIAERQLAAQGEQVGIAVADLYPQFSIGGSIGASTNTTADKSFIDLFDSGSVSAGLLGSFQWNLFNYGRLKSNIRLQDAVFQELLVDYRETILQAQGEVENAIIAFLRSQDQARFYGVAADFAQRAADISTAQYEDGLVDFNTVISTLRSLAAQQDLQAAARGMVVANLVQVYKSLGGGWEVRAGRDPVALLPDSTKEEMRERMPKRWKKVLN